MADDRAALAERRDTLRTTYQRGRADRPATTARGVHHVALICRDVEETIRFYQDLLGWPLAEVMENRDYPGSTHFFFDIGNDNLLAFFDFPGLGLGDVVEAIGGLQHLAISVTPEAFEAIGKRLDDASVGYVGPERGVVDSMYFRDPNGVQVEVTRDPLCEMGGVALLD